jgi:ribosomal protein S18 acetylase RimI-like enzyme
MRMYGSVDCGVKEAPAGGDAPARERAGIIGAGSTAMRIRPFRASDARELAALAAHCARGESDFVLNPLWESEEELFAEFERHGIEPETHILVADAELEGATGFAGYLRSPGAPAAALLCPIVRREERGQGLGGELLRAVLAKGGELGIHLASAAVGTRNRFGYSLLTAYGFRPVRQVFMMRCDEKPRSGALPIEGLRAEPASDGDAAAIHAVYTTCGFDPRTPEQMEKVLRDGRHEHAVARDAEGRVVAFVELETHWPARPWVAFVGVLPELRDRGLGSTLVSWALAPCFERGAHAALLMLSPANRTAVRAYEKVGFRRHRLVDVLERAIP